jgi:hypothetical protein
VIWIVGDAASGGLRYHGRAVGSCAEPYDSLYLRSLRHEVAVLGSHDAKVVITTEAYARIFGATDADRATDCNNRLRREVASQTGAQLVDLFGYICPHRQCRTEQNGVTLRPDGQHYEGRGGRLVAKWLIDQIAASR